MSVPALFDLPDQPPPVVASAPAVAVGVAQTQALYRKYRPQTFEADELVGQEHVVQTLRNAIRLGRIAHAYLFCGPRGTGKTTTARLLAKAVNCLDPDPDRRPCGACASCLAIASGGATDVIEIDAASNRGIDDIRDLRERVKYAPTQLRTKFYIIDEAHQITGPAANAFLKTLEEPPLHTKFVLATTDAEELLPTIISRCQRFDFRRLPLDAVVARLHTVAAAEGLRVDPEAAATIARHATGSLRDALGLLDQLSVYGEVAGATGHEAGGGDAITVEAVRALLGVSRNDRVEALAQALADRDVSAALGTVNTAVAAGEDPRALNRQLVSYLRVLLHERAGGSPDADERASALAARFDLGELAELARRFSEIDYRIRHAPFSQLPLEVALVEGVLRPDRTSAAAIIHAESQATGRAEPAGRQPPVDVPRARPAADAGVYAKPPATTLRDRLRAGGSAPMPPLSSAESSPAAPADPPPPASALVPPRAASTTPAASSGGPEPAISAPSGNGAGAASAEVERLAELWPRIRQDVKAVNRRIEALLSSIDPLAVQGDRITLAAAYDFHRNRLNSDEVRIVVEEAIGRVIGRPVQVTCVLRGEHIATAAMAPARVTAAEPVPASTDADAANSEPHGDDQRLDALKNLFDAEDITPDDA